MLRPSFLLLASAQGRPALDEAHPLVSAAGLLDTSATHPLVSPAGSGPAPRWGASRTDRSGNVDRFAAERHRRSLTPSRKPTEWWSLAFLYGRGNVIL